MQTFVSIISDDIALLEKRIKGETEAGKTLDLSELLESAVYLGAERIQNFFEESTIKNEKVNEEIKDSECRLLLRELKILQDTLQSSTPNEVPTVKKENGKNDSEKKVVEDTLDNTQKKD